MYMVLTCLYGREALPEEGSGTGGRKWTRI